MTTADVLAWLGEASLVLAFAVLLILLTRLALRRRVRPAQTYALWLAVPAALLARLTPAGLVLDVDPPAFPADPAYETTPRTSLHSWKCCGGGSGAGSSARPRAQLSS
jgi:beta-lactamase regulating signal transducer with metallopeptidase domain